MLSRIKKMFRTPETNAGLAGDASLRALALELDQREDRIRTLSADLERERGRHDEDVERAVAAFARSLFAELATPMAQLALQRALIRDGQPVEVDQVVAVGSRIVSVLNSVGMDLIGQVGSQEPYDPMRHQPLSQRSDLAPGVAVTVRVPGAGYHGVILTKVGVEPPNP